MSAIKEAYIMFNGQKVVATYDEGTKTWTATTNAPANSSWSQPDHIYPVEIHAVDAANNREAFEVTNAHWMLKNGDEIESEGECSLEAPRSDRWILDTGPIRPMRPDNYYVLEFSYDVIDDHLIHAVGLRTVGGQNGK